VNPLLQGANRADLSHLSPTTVQAFLRARGWSLRRDLREATPPLELAEYVSGEEVIYLPLNRDMADYSRRLHEALADVARAMEMDESALVMNLFRPEGDRVVVRVESPDTARQALPFLGALQLREGLKELLMAAAHSAISRQRYFSRLSQQEAVQLLKEAVELPAEGGSFITSIVLPVGPRLGELDLEEPFGRRTAQLLLHALNTVKRIRDLGGLAELADKADDGVSGNLLQALSKLRSVASDIELTIGVDWSQTRPAPAEGAPSHISFDNAHLSDLERVADSLKAQEAFAGTELRGHVYLLKRQEGEVSGQIILTPEDTGTTGLKLNRVQLTLGGPAYTMAIKAHEDQHRLHVTGTLRRVGRTWQLDDAAIVAVVALDDEA
jgi:hypothetical protein